MKRILAIVAAMAMFAVEASESEIVKVKGRGVGADKTEALKDAYRDAVERAVGLYVDAKQMMKNVELVKDQILTQSNAYIERYDVAKETTKPNGLVEIQILAEVRKSALTKKISDVMPTKTFRLSDGLKNEHAKLTTVEKRNVDGAALLGKVLDGFNPLALVADCALASTKYVMRETRNSTRDSGDMISVNYLFRKKIDQDRYFKYVVPRLKDVLDQISLAEPQEFTAQIRMKDSFVAEEKIAEASESKACMANFSGANIATVKECHCKIVKEDTEGILVLVTGINKYNTVLKCVRYELDRAAVEIFDKWRERELVEPGMVASIVDATGETICRVEISGANAEVRFNRDWCISVFKSGLTGREPIWHPKTGRRVYTFTVAPFSINHCALGLEYFDWHEFIIPKDALPEVQDMKIELAK